MSLENDEYVAGQAVETGNYSEAVRLLRPLAERNSQYALLALGWIYESGVTGNRDSCAARALYEQAASSGSAAACHYLGWLLVRDGQTREAISVFERGALLNNEGCKAALARFRINEQEQVAERAFQDGKYEDALSLLKPLAERNSQYALCTLGYILELGLTGTPDKEAARLYYERAAAEGDGIAYFDLGRLLSQEGEEVEARAAFQSGAERGHVSSMSRLGGMIVDGRGGPADLDAGIAWLQRAAARGDVLARRKLLIIEKQNAESLLKRLWIGIKVAALRLRWAKQLSERPHADHWLRSFYLEKAGSENSRVWKWLLRASPSR
jgi:hypothetical protein